MFSTEGAEAGVCENTPLLIGGKCNSSSVLLMCKFLTPLLKLFSPKQLFILPHMIYLLINYKMVLLGFQKAVFKQISMGSLNTLYKYQNTWDL